MQTNNLLKQVGVQSRQRLRSRQGRSTRLRRRPLPPSESRFLFVDVAAQRANQLRRGALPRLPQLRADPVTGVRPQGTMKLERVAMDEVRQGLITYELPAPKPTPSGKAV